MQPRFPMLMRRFLYDQLYPNSTIPSLLVFPESLPMIEGMIEVFNSTIATFHAPSDISGVTGMRREHIWATPSQTLRAYTGLKQPVLCFSLLSGIKKGTTLEHQSIGFRLWVFNLMRTQASRWQNLTLLMMAVPASQQFISTPFTGLSTSWPLIKMPSSLTVHLLCTLHSTNSSHSTLTNMRTIMPSIHSDEGRST